MDRYFLNHSHEPSLFRNLCGSLHLLNSGGFLPLSCRTCLIFCLKTHSSSALCGSFEDTIECSACVLPKTRTSSIWQMTSCRLSRIAIMLLSGDPKWRPTKWGDECSEEIGLLCERDLPEPTVSIEFTEHSGSRQFH